ncbi:hypothetical protein [Pseudobutyrivibrio sp.]
MNFENKLSSQNVHYSRYIASFVKECSRLGVRFGYDKFLNWLTGLGLKEDEAMDIAMLAFCGRVELEVSATKYLTNLKKEES